jgi:hypothetical protein
MHVTHDLQLFANQATRFFSTSKDSAMTSDYNHQKQCKK